MLCIVSAPFHNFCVPCQYIDGDISRLSSEGRNSGTRPVRTAGTGVSDSSSAWRRFFKRAESRGSLLLSSRRCRRIRCHTLLYNRGPWFELVEVLFGLCTPRLVVGCEHVGMTMAESGSSSCFGRSGFWLLGLLPRSLLVAWLCQQVASNRTKQA